MYRFGCAHWAQEKLFDEKTREEKSHDSVPLMYFSFCYISCSSADDAAQS